MEDVQTFARAIADDNLDTVQKMLASGYQLGQFPYSKERNTELHLAAENLRVNISRLLVRHGAEVNRTDAYGRTPLYLVLCGNTNFRHRYDLCELLLLAGADSNIAENEGRSALHMMLVFNQNTPATGNSVATKEEAMSLLRLLVKHGANPAQPGGRKTDHLTPFQVAVNRGLLAPVRFFIEECGEDPGQRTVAGRTLIQLAGSNVEMKALLRSAKTELAIRDVILDSKKMNVPVASTRSGGMSPL